MVYKTKKIIFYSLLALVFMACITILYINRIKIGRILTPFIIGLIIAYLMHPMIVKMENKKIKRSVAIILLYILFALSIGVGAMYVIPEVTSNTRDLIVTIPNIATQYEKIFNNFIFSIESSTWPDELKNTIMSEITIQTEALQRMAVYQLKHTMMSFVDNILGLFDIILSLIIAYYFLKDSNAFKESALSLTPRKWRNWLVGVGREMNIILSNFIQGQLLTALIVGILESIGLIIIKAKYPFVLGMVGGIFNIIPYFGPFLGAIPAVVVALIESPVKAFWTVVVFTIVQQIDNGFISPKIIEGKLGLHPISTILAVLVGGEFYGIPGMLVAVPIAAIIKVICKRALEALV